MLALYHSSYTEVTTPDLSKCARFKDFGRGFYLTTSLQQAKSFVSLSVRKAQYAGMVDTIARKGYVSKFTVDSNDWESLCTLEFPGANLEWLSCIVAHRLRRPSSPIVQKYAGYDVISGKIADDQTNITLALYMEGAFGQVGSTEAVRTCMDRLMPERLKDQYCFRTERALRCLAFSGSEGVWT